jgi:hypothetical protein
MCIFQLTRHVARHDPFTLEEHNEAMTVGRRNSYRQFDHVPYLTLAEIFTLE